jgi:hypothetical protein
VNDTVREVGGALGVAVIGSVAATSYSSSVRGDLTRFPELTDTALATLTDNAGAAIEMSHNLGPNGAEILTIVRNAFIDSMSGALWVSAAAAIGAAVLALVYLPRDAGAHRAAHAHRVDGDGSVDHLAAVPEPVGARGLQ